jgi:hypothetical protein
MRRLIICAVCLFLVVGSAMSQEPAKKATLHVEKADTIRTLLAKEVDKKVTLLLVQGQELTGTVRSVGDGVVLVSELSGREYYDAAVDLEKIVAVLVKVRGQ